MIGGNGDGNGNAPRTVSIAYLKSLYKGTPHTVDGSLYISGRIVSNDFGGNMYRVVYLEDDTGAIAIKVDTEELSSYFRWGRTMKVTCNSLVVGAYGGQLQLGISSPYPQYETDYIPEYLFPSIFEVSSEAAEELIPANLFIETLSPRYVGCYVRIHNVQFIEEQLGMKWFDKEIDEGSYSERYLVNPAGDTLTVSTSSHARFADVTIPSGSGSIIGILSYFGGNYQFILQEVSYQLLGQERFPVNR